RLQQPCFPRAGGTSMFSPWPWYRNLVESVPVPGEGLRIYTVDAAQADGAPRAVLMMRSRGRALRGLSNYYTSLFGPVLDPSEPDIPGVLDSLVQAMVRDETRWDTIDLHPLAFDSPVYPALAQALANAGFAVQ